MERLDHQTTGTLNYRERPWSLNGWSCRERLSKEAFCSPATRGLKKDSDRARTLVEAVHVPAHLALPGSLQAKQLWHLHAQLSLGQSCHRQKNVLHLCTQGHFGSVQLFVTLQTVACQASLSERGFSRQELLERIGQYQLPF